SIQKLFCKLYTGVLDELNVGLQPAVERHRNLPWARECFRIFDRHFVVDGVGTDRSVTLRQVQRSAVEVSSPVEPVLAVETRYVDDKRIVVPVADRMTHICVVRRALYFIEMDGAGGVRKRERHLNLIRALH